MMIKTAGGPGLVSPIDFHERRTPRFSKATWVATGIVVAAHVGLGAALYYQRFEIPVVERPEGPIIEVFNVRRPRPPEPVTAAKEPPAPNTRIHETPRPSTPVEAIAVVPNLDAAPTDSTTLTFTEVVAAPAVNSPAREPIPAAAPVIRNPSWSRQPSADQLMRAYPDRAITVGVAGSASLNCLVLPSGAVTDCNVTRETPGGYGFGRAAQSLSRHFVVNPRTVNGAAEGSRVSINLRFALPAD
ncbi:MAG: TonB family protein [Brevundimonas sp.]|uniref:TonB family protein n=1 Tax=Brevundimonas sp. TaxID=1871086 RepID=UPI00271CCB7C|nr:TonB family protein [Brevundimonas sp.]MDO9587658.1 TonB family protein [Brevundimonas sp.]MDP3371143.1 TonB family protein [Brevundimonas sp.]MDZ4110530.1 TonB family protein [Brevundimonas sp.]